MNNKNEIYSQYKNNLELLLVEISTSMGFLNGQLLMVDELDSKWDEIANEYVADAILEISSYPTVAVAWASYIGMAIASLWDKDWEQYSENKDLYKTLVTPRGFDCMDEYIMEDILGLKLDSKEAQDIENLLRTLSQKVVGMIRKENIEPQSPEAFYIYADSVKIMFHIGVSLWLTKLGYKYEKVILDSSFV